MCYVGLGGLHELGLGRDIQGFRNTKVALKDDFGSFGRFARGLWTFST